VAIKRLNYFKGEFLQESDFTDEQQYHMDKLRKHNEKLHEWGIVDGLEVVQIGNTPAVSISAGTAIDNNGNQLEQSVNISRNIPDVSPQYLVISYDEEEKDPRNDTGIMENTRIEELPDIEFLASADPANQIILAAVTLNNGNYKIDLTIRKYATAHIPDNSITSANIASNAVTTDKIANNAVTADKITDGSVGTAKLADNSVTSAKLQSHSSTDASRAVTTDHIRNMAITTAKLATLSIGTAELKDGSVTSAKIANDAITSDKLVSGSVGTDKLINGSVTNPKIAAGAVTQDKIAPLSVGGAELANDAVTGAKIADGSVGTLELADGSVTAGKIAVQSVGIDKLRSRVVYNSTYSIAANSSLALDLDELQDIAAFYLTSIYSITNGGTITWEIRSMMKQVDTSYGPMSYFYRTILIRNLSTLLVNIRAKVHRIYEI
jgi:hypothetical protein